MSKYGLYSAERFHLLSETFKMVYADRAEYMGDKEFISVPKRTLSKDYAKVLQVNDE